MSYDFDTPIDRRNTDSLKWDIYRGRDVLPMWVADMDFASPPEVIAALKKRVDHGVFGYTLTPVGLKNTIIERLKTRHGWEARPEWIVWLPGLVTGLNVACRAVASPKDAVLTTTPAYPPFLSAPALAGCELITVDLPVRNGMYQIDFEDLESAVTPRTRLFILCNPHNPTGRVFTRSELTRLAEICLSRDIIICSDEIHCDLILDIGNRHISMAALDQGIAQRTITLLSPSKTFNLPGLGCSLAVIPDEGLRKRFTDVMQGIVPHVNTLGLTAALAAYRDGEDWRLALIDYLRHNRNLVEAFVERTPGLAMSHVEATYLAWIDARDLGVKDACAFFDQAGVGLSDGKDFGGPGFVRLNFGCPRATLQRALERMAQAITGLKRG
ncbi:MAG TPA: PatB family C-S lyase [Deltaproteobacteria bacterium]|nr:PatB family C-S lyase [Deltaproteobacteria bacterium]